MDLRTLRSFLVLAEEGHFGRAAERLHIVQPALSMQIRALEEELGGPLFLRTSRRVELTDAGRLLQLEAQRTLTQAEHAKQSVSRMMRGELGRVRVGFAGNAVLSGKLSHDLRSFHAAYPDAELVVRESAPQAQMAAILAGELDLGYTPDHGLELAPSLQAEKIGNWRFVAALSDTHPLAARRELTAKMIATQPLVLYAANQMDEALLAALRPLLAQEPKVAHRAATTLGVLALVTAGLGIALVPDPMEQLRLPNIVYKPLRGLKLSANLVLVSRRQEASGAVLAYLALARQQRL
ncbi:LysR family transcriptional regulator [Duganella sp. FT80W]|uniref:LysR family transcriptional regulator n=1 Tax=Duganella guangzhouensis TaxID=2666084 RepID=A0A6I2LBY0_9BURK|nr:LysR substrate-binding domain-containing protein [Duganella guangzhouensis]MRW94657.1 LysR family transcriptional regulator [Duganella guangzhouensis]